MGKLIYYEKIYKGAILNKRRFRFETDVKLDGISWENFEEDTEKREGPITESDTTYTFHVYRRVAI